MKRECCPGTCQQGKTCPLRTVRFSTYRSPARRLLDHWVVIAMIYAVPAGLFIAANWEQLK